MVQVQIDKAREFDRVERMISAILILGLFLDDPCLLRLPVVCIMASLICSLR